MAKRRRIEISKTVEVDVDVDVDVEIDFDDVEHFLDSVELTPTEKDRVIELLDLPINTVLPATIMDELAVEELKELIKIHGYESILAMVKAGQGVIV